MLRRRPQMMCALELRLVCWVFLAYGRFHVWLCLFVWRVSEFEQLTERVCFFWASRFFFCFIDPCLFKLYSQSSSLFVEYQVGGFYVYLCVNICAVEIRRLFMCLKIDQFWRIPIKWHREIPHSDWFNNEKIKILNKKKISIVWHASNKKKAKKLKLQHK